MYYMVIQSHYASVAAYIFLMMGFLRVAASVGSVRFEVFTEVTMKNVVFWDIKTQFVPHRRHITSPLQSPAS
jgi:hypothetical protein